MKKNMEKTIGTYVGHCLEPSCDIGYFYFVCPTCNKHTDASIDYWQCLEGEKQEIECEHCKSKLQVEWSNEEYEFWVTEKP